VSIHQRWIQAALLAGLAMTLVTTTAGVASAQQHQPPPAQPAIIDEGEDTLPGTPAPQPAKPAHTQALTAAPTLQSDPGLDADDQLAPSQLKQPMPAAVAEPTGGERTHAATRAIDGTAGPAVSAKLRRAAMPVSVACAGVFGPDSSHAKLALAFRSRNVTFTQIDGSSGAKTMASVLFAKDPTRRLEVWWSKPASRSDIHLIVINGRSDWMAPGELRLGLTLPDVEKLNGKPFKLSGFDKSDVATLSSWNGGALAKLPGGCKVGISLRAALAAAPSAIGDAPAEREFTSTDSAVRAVNPTISEILVAY
jgi:hypothetical protein